MVDVIGRAKVIVSGDVDARSIDQAGSKIGSSLKVGAAVGVAALGTLAVAGYKAFQSFEEAEAASRRLTNVLDNMGKAEAAPAVEKLADELRKLTGVDDEVIKGGQTILATFSEVAESAGEIGGTFERATRASVDLAAAGFGSVESASVMLGKALQDPEKGITALSRAGVTFTDEQKKLIESFIAANDVASAQALILGEVERQVKGTAEASATESEKIASAMGELKETFGLFIDDLITGGEETKTFSEQLEALNEELIELQESEGWEGVSGAIRGIGKAIKFVVGLLGEWSAFWEEAGGDFRDFQQTLDEGYKAIAAGWRDLIDDLQETANDLPFIGRFIDAPSESSGRAHGGPASGLTLVGERGPELLELPAGSYVHNNNATKEMLSGGGEVNLTVNNYGPVSGSDMLQDIEWSARYGALSAAGGYR